MHGGSHRTRALKFEARQQAAVCHLLFVGWYYLKLFAVPPRELHRFYVPVSPSWRVSEAHCMFCIPTPPMFAYSFGFFGAENNVLSATLRNHDY